MVSHMHRESVSRQRRVYPFWGPVIAIGFGISNLQRKLDGPDEYERWNPAVAAGVLSIPSSLTLNSEIMRIPLAEITWINLESGRV